MYASEKLIHLSSRQLLAFLEVVRLRSMSKAAESIPMSQSGMSMLIKELEDQIGARLFDRNPRSVTLTDSGRELLPVAQRIHWLPEAIVVVRGELTRLGQLAQGFLFPDAAIAIN